MINKAPPKKFLKLLITSFFIYMIFEGILRKWIFPNLSTQIYFVKDIFLIIIYLIALKYDLIFKLKFSKLFIVLIIVISLFGFIGYDFSKNGIISFMLGIRSYWVFLPLFLIIIHLYDKSDLNKFLKLNLYLVLPYFLLIYLQSHSHHTAIINSGYDKMILNPERPSGYFTYTTQNTYYFLFLFLSLCSFILNKKELFTKDIIILSLSNFLLISVMILLKSRAVYFYVIVTVLYSTFFLIFSNSENILKLKKIFLILLVSGISFSLSSSDLFFKDQYNYSEFRMNSDIPNELNFVKDFEDKSFEISLPLTQKKEVTLVNITVKDYCSKYSTFCRIINDLYFLPAIYSSTSFGKGIGAGTAPVVIFNKQKPYYLGENDSKRTIMELGYYVGLVLVLIKFLFVIILNFFALYKYRDKDNLIYIPMIVFVSTQLLLGPITYTVSFISYIFWIIMGFVFISFNQKDKNIKI